MFAAHRHPDAGSYLHAAVTDHRRLPQSRDDPFCHTEGGVCVGDPVEQDGELIAAQAGDEVTRPDRLIQALRGDSEQFVARPVTEAVVHILEVVEVDEQHRERAVSSFIRGKGRSKPIGERRPIREAR